jgi:hypothetical protein
MLLDYIPVIVRFMNVLAEFVVYKPLLVSSSNIHRR